MSLDTTCCFTGHRDLAPDHLQAVLTGLAAQVDLAIAEGYRTFLCGFAIGMDLAFAELVAQRKRADPSLRLVAILPHPKAVPLHTDMGRLLACCDQVIPYAPTYGPGNFLARDRVMVDRSRRVIGVHDGRTTGGTAYTLAYARKHQRDVFVVGTDGQVSGTGQLSWND